MKGRQLRVLFSFAKDEAYGAAMVGMRYARGLRDQGMDVHALVQDDGPSGHDLAGTLRSLGVKAVATNAYRRTGRPLAASRALASIVRSHGIDVLVSLYQVDVKHCAIASKLTGVRYLSFKQSLRSFHGIAPVARAKASGYGVLSRHAPDRVVCVSEAVRREMVERFGTDPSRTVTVRNGVTPPATLADLPSGERERRRREWFGAEDVIIGMTVGRIARQKGLDVLVEAASRVAVGEPRFRLVMVGEEPSPGTPYKRELLERVERVGLGDRVRLLGWREDVPELLACADMLVQPSRWEGLPLTVLEAAANALPVVYTTCFGTLDGFDAERGMLDVPPENADALADALLRLAALDPSARRLAGADNRRVVQRHYTLESSIERFAREVRAVARAERPAKVGGGRSSR